MSLIANTDERTVDADVPDDDDAPRERLSLARLGILVLIIAAITGGISYVVREASSTAASTTKSWSIPYVDVTLTPSYEFQNPQSNPAKDIALAFVVADPTAPCTPTWGGAYSLEQASQDLELDRRITQLRAAGGQVMISFGGAANQELAVACEDVTKLTDAYRTVVARYDAQEIDLDVEGTAIADSASIKRRAQAVATLQKERAAAKQPPLRVWITAPVATSGLTADGVAMVTATIAGGVDVTGVNAMTMDFGSADQPTGDMLAATKSALDSTAKQLGEIYRTQGVTLDETQRWARLGATPMIGQNDVDGEVFTLDDAKGLAQFATAKGLGRVSLWSLNRDAPCSTSFTDVMVLSNTCSSVAQEPLQFANVFTSLTGASAGQPIAVVRTDAPKAVDDPAKSPFPVWRSNAQYPGGYKVVRGGQVYEAKWYSAGQDPAATVSNATASPWTLVGPVEAADKPYAPTTVAPGTYPAWDLGPLYTMGDKVLFNGLPYEARWPNKAEAPSTLFPVGPDSAWKPLFTLAGEPPES